MNFDGKPIFLQKESPNYEIFRLTKNTQSYMTQNVSSHIIILDIFNAYTKLKSKLYTTIMHIYYTI